MLRLVTTRQAAARLGVHRSRVLALIAAGTLSATRAGNQWLIDPDSLDHHAYLVAAGATGRSFAPRTAWAAAALCDGHPDGLAPSERYRLRARLDRLLRAATGDLADTAAVMSRWLSRRAAAVHHYRAGEPELTALLAARGVTATGISTALTYNLGMGDGGSADAYVYEHALPELEKQFVLINSERGNLRLRVLDAATATPRGPVAPRLIAGVDLFEDTDTRTRAAGLELIGATLRRLRTGNVGAATAAPGETIDPLDASLSHTHRR